jgi:Holliday junction resolvase RusA-like endonuclease
MTSKSFAAHTLEWMRGVAVGGLLTLRVDANPAPASRPRVAKNGGVYYSKGYTEFYAECQKQFAHQVGHEGLRAEGRTVVLLQVAVRRPPTSKLTDPRGDADNYAKGPLDAAQKAGFWPDDDKAIGIAVWKRWAEKGEDPGVLMHVARIS